MEYSKKDEAEKRIHFWYMYCDSDEQHCLAMIYRDLFRSRLTWFFELCVSSRKSSFESISIGMESSVGKVPSVTASRTHEHNGHGEIKLNQVGSWQAFRFGPCPWVRGAWVIHYTISSTTPNNGRFSDQCDHDAHETFYLWPEGHCKLTCL